ncbi:MAG: hypothetical protein PHH16_01685 [Candidatus Gracilibacteria bacterium]|nr:hypothetical protein [Candidatus Gracilibacteria bacterium]
MFINFSSILTWMFKSFDIAGDTKLLEKLEKDEVRFLMIIKKHWIYSILMSWRVLFVVIIACANVYLLIFGQKATDNITLGIAVFLAINVVWWLIVVSIYIRRFYTIQGNKPYIEDIHSAIKKSHLSDTAFEHFFNQTILLLILLVGITVFVLFTSIMGFFFSGDIHASLGIANVILLMIQTGLFYGYLNAMINQEMDFKVVVPGQIFFYNQLGIFGDSQSMNADKIKTINSKHAGLFGAFVNYGTVIILTEGDQGANGQMDMEYVGSPLDTVTEMQRVLNKDYASMEKSVNLLLRKFENEIGIENIDTPENKEKLREFIENNDAMIQGIFKNGDSETKQEVRELYILIQGS